MNEPGTERTQYVYNMLLVRARDIYGYHKDGRVYIKVIMWVPGCCQQACHASEYTECEYQHASLCRKLYAELLTLQKCPSCIMPS